MQGDTVRESGIKQTTPKGQTRIPWASIFCCKENSLVFCADEVKSRSFFVRRQIIHLSVLGNQLHIFKIEI